ncbi:MAG: putative ABC transporter permease [Candidatus Gracilibacteria bacterium]|jgi:uncharacterized membrane protein|nr:putative ABC transporter permease [Candidatus Gracilibacteria bacterium]
MYIYLLFLFITASIAGWIMEIFYRSIQSKRIINPGFLNGPYLPIYGTSAAIIFGISNLEIHEFLKLAIFTFLPTIGELITGIFFYNFYKIRLWDYSKEFLNFKGFICPLYSFYWAILSLLFHKFLTPKLENFFLKPFSTIEILIMGIIFGIMILDMWNSFNIANKIKKIVLEITAEEKRKFSLDYFNLKSEIPHHLNRGHKFIQNFILPFRNLSNSHIKNFLKKINSEKNRN